MSNGRIVTVFTTAALAFACIGAAPASAQDETGFNNLSVGQISAETSASILDRVGADIDRVTLNWSILERDPGVFRWGGWDAIYQADLARGIRPIFQVVGAPVWARGNACEGVTEACFAPPTREYYDEAARVAAMAAQRYPRAAAIEVWNEPNTPFFWRPRPDPTAYAALLAEIHDAVKAANPSMTVIGPGTASGAGSLQTGKIGGAEFLGAVYLAGGGEHLDAISLHAYPSLSRPTVDSARNEVARVRWVRDVLGDPSMPLWVTETGVSTTGPNAVDMMKQGEIIRDLNTALKAEPGVEMLLIHTLMEPPVPEWHIERGYGVMTAGFWPKPALCVLAAAWSEAPLC